MRSFKYSLIAIGACFLLVSCASVVSGPNRKVTIASNPTGVEFVVKRNNGASVSNGVTPATVSLNSAAGYFQPAKYLVEFKRKGEVQSIPISASLNKWYFGNLLFGGFGLIGLLVVDPATGAMWKLEGPVAATFQDKTKDETIQIAAPVKKSAKKLRVANTDDVPMHLRGNLVAVR